MSISIYQTESINFEDSTIGGTEPYQRIWTFQGGSIPSATGATANVVYNTPGDYDVTLQITDDNNVTDSKYSANLVTVLVASVTASFTKTLSSLMMSQTVDFTDTSIGSPNLPDTWEWDISGTPYSTPDPSLKFDDWVDVHGAIMNDPPGQIRTITAQLTASKGILVDNTSQSINVSKVGMQEAVYINTDGDTELWRLSSTMNIQPLTGSGASLPIDNYIFEVNIGDTGGGVSQSISNFHSTMENAELTTTGIGGEALFNNKGIGTVDGIIAINNFVYNSGDDMIGYGNYLIPGLEDKIYFMDLGGISDLINSYNYSQELVTSIIQNPYPMLHSAQAYTIAGDFQENPEALGDFYNPIILSPKYFDDEGFSGKKYTINIDVDYDGYPHTIEISFDANGGTGNSLNGLYYKMQDDSGGLGTTGAVYMINDAIANSSLPGGTGTIEAYASSEYSVIPSADSDSHNGILINIKEYFINGIVFSDNSAELNALEPSLTVTPFSIINPDEPNSCVGMPGILNLKSYRTGRGRKINYGGSIY